MNGSTNTCGGSLLAFGATIKLSGGSVGGMSSCAITIPVYLDPGNFTNASITLFSNEFQSRVHSAPVTVFVFTTWVLPFFY